MEYRLSKIDTELRQMVNDSTKEGRVHGNKESFKVDKDKKERNKPSYNEQLQKELIKKNKKKIIVDAIKVDTVDVDAFMENKSENLTQGRFLDTKR